MNRRLVLFASGVMLSAAVTVAADVPAASSRTSSGPATTIQSLPVQGAIAPADLTASISAIWLRLRGMSSC